MTRTRRCSWETGYRCHKPATRRVQATYLGQPTDHDVLLCDEHAEITDTLVRPGWEITNIEPLAQEVQT
jgi:hypothetical protein